MPKPDARTLLKTVPAPSDQSPLATASRPLLRLVQSLTGVESAFITSIDWDTQRQTILFSRNTGSLDLAEGSVVDWGDSMCRSVFLFGATQSGEIGVDVPASLGAEALGMKTFFAVPILVDDVAIGTVCGASGERIRLDDLQLERVGFVAEALQQLLKIERDMRATHARALQAEDDAESARQTAEQHAAELLEMERLAHTDALTELPNRRAFMARWEDELARSARKRYPIGLVFLDADHFKEVNDSAGHEMGDAVLRAIGAALSEVVRGPDMAARLGGDEFALMTTHKSDEQLREIAAEIQRHFRASAGQLEVRTTLSIGLATSKHCPRDTLLQNADRALYSSKEAGGDTVRMFICDSPDDGRGTMGTRKLPGKAV